MNLQFSVAVIFAAFVLSWPASAGPGGYQIDPAHDGRVVFEKSFTAPLKKKWVRDFGETVAYPVAAANTVFVTAYAGTSTDVFALNERTGETIWHKSVTGSYATVAYDKGRVFAISRAGDITALDAATGTVAWKQKLSGNNSVGLPATAANGLLYVNGAGSGATLYALHEDNGKLAWSHDSGKGGDSSPGIAEGRVYVGYPCEDDAFDAKSGALDWSHTLGCSGGGGGAPAYFDGLLYVDDTFTANVFDPAAGNVVRPFVAEEYAPAFWTASDGSSKLGFVISNGLTAFSTGDGNTVWTRSDIDFSIAPIVVNDMLIAGDSSGTLYVLNVLDGSTLWSTNVGTEIGGCCSIQRGLGAGDNMLFVPAGNQLFAWVSKH